MRLQSLFSISLVVYVAVLLGVQLALPRTSLPAHLLGHPVKFIPNLLSQQTADELLELMKRIKEFPTNQSDQKFYTAKHEHIGEAVPMVNGDCEHPFLVPNINRTACILPGRIDIGRHYIMSGGVQGLKERYETLVARLQSFGVYLFSPKYEEVKKLFADESFLSAARSVCPASKPVLDPFQFNFIVQVPGQTVAVHVDGVYFWGATRFEFPQWLLAAMQFSGMWQEHFIDQIQVVAYLHRWTDNRDGSFVYWETQQHSAVPPTPLAGSIVDGSKVVHAATVYQKAQKPPMLDKSKENKLVYVGNDKWEVRSGGKLVNTYTTDDLRVSIVYRARCFESEERKQQFYDFPEEQKMKLRDVLLRFTDDMIEKGVLSENQAHALEPLDLALKILDTYIKYPLSPTAYIPYNYCALPRLVPALAPVFSKFC